MGHKPTQACCSSGEREHENVGKSGLHRVILA
jgi:hypothetical protein